MSRPLTTDDGRAFHAGDGCALIVFFTALFWAVGILFAKVHRLECRAAHPAADTAALVRCFQTAPWKTP